MSVATRPIGAGKKNLSIPYGEAGLKELDDLAAESLNADRQPMNRAEYVRALIDLARRGKLRVGYEPVVLAAAENAAGYGAQASNQSTGGSHHPPPRREGTPIAGPVSQPPARRRKRGAA